MKHEPGHSYQEVIQTLCKEAGEVLRRDFFSKDPSKERWKENNTPITETELRVSYLAIAFLKQYFPEHNVMGEDERDMSVASDYLWVFDPVDGTIGFTHGLPTFVFSIALVYKGEVIVGAVYDPILDRLFYAEKGKGTTLNGVPTTVTPSSSLIGRLVGIGGGHKDTLDLGALHNCLRDHEAKVINIYSTPYMGALVASGYLAAVVFGGRNMFDAAAVKLLVEEAGGKVSSLTGTHQRYDQETSGFVATNGTAHDFVLEAIAPALLSSK